MNTDIPKRLYKYRAASTQDITSLSAGKLWFSSPALFNDPFDCAYDIVVPEFSRAECGVLLERISDGKYNAAHLARHNDEQLQQQVKAGLTGAVTTGLSNIGGVCCFSGSPSDLLTWGHYANGHRGFCLEFDTSKDLMFKKAKQVRYSDTLPKLGKETFTEGDSAQILELVLTKAKCWEYEHEWRVLHKDAQLLVGYERSSLTGIYFGAKMPDDIMQLIASLLETTDTKLYRMRLGKSSFELVPEGTTFTRIDYRTGQPLA